MFRRLAFLLMSSRSEVDSNIDSLKAWTAPSQSCFRSHSPASLNHASSRSGGSAFTRPLTERIRTGHVLVALFAAPTLFSTWRMFMFFFSG